jgi:hypothetical protein
MDGTPALRFVDLYRGSAEARQDRGPVAGRALAVHADIDG